MKSFFLKLAGIDEHILDRIEHPHKNMIVGVGFIVFVLFLFSFFSTAYLLTYLVKDTLIDCIIAFLFATIVMNFYRFTLCSTMWRIVEFDKPKDLVHPDNITTIIRMATCAFFIILVTKPFELWLFHNGLTAYLDNRNANPDNLYTNFSLLNHHYPATWLITFFILVIFLLPIYFRTYSKKWGNYEYELLQNSIFIATINNHYNWFLSQYKDAFRQRGLNINFQTKYSDPPFGTKLKPTIVNTKGKPYKEGTNTQFYDLLDQMPIKS